MSDSAARQSASSADRARSPSRRSYEASHLLTALQSEERALFATALYAGLRRGELRALRWENLDLATGVIRVERSWDPKEGPVDPKSRAGRRRVPMAAVLRDYLVEHRASRRDDRELVFGRGDGRTFDPTTVQDRARRAWKTAKLDGITLHECRHTFASFMIAAGVNT